MLGALRLEALQLEALRLGALKVGHRACRVLAVKGHTFNYSYAADLEANNPPHPCEME
jgi:hypothetical protein